MTTTHQSVHAPARTPFAPIKVNGCGSMDATIKGIAALKPTHPAAVPFPPAAARNEQDQQGDLQVEDLGENRELGETPRPQATLTALANNNRIPSTTTPCGPPPDTVPQSHVSQYQMQTEREETQAVASQQRQDVDNGYTKSFSHRPTDDPSQCMNSKQQDGKRSNDQRREEDFDLFTLKQAFTTQYYTLANKCQGWERYAAKLKAQLEALEVDASLLRETCTRQIAHIENQDRKLEAQAKYLQRVESENADLKEVFRERENRSREVESRLSSLEERIASQAASSATSTATSIHCAQSTASSRLAAKQDHIDQHLKSFLQDAYQPLSPPASIIDASQTRNHTVGGPEHDGRVAFHSSNIRYSSDEEDPSSIHARNRGLRAPSPLDFSTFEKTLADVAPLRHGQTNYVVNGIVRPASRVASRQGHRHNADHLAFRDETFVPSREGGRESRLGHRNADESVVHYHDSAAPGRFIDENGSIQMSERPARDFMVDPKSSSLCSYSLQDDLPTVRPPSRFDRARESAPSPPSMATRVGGDRPRGIERQDVQHGHVTKGPIGFPSQILRSTSAVVGLNAPQPILPRSGSIASVHTVTSNGNSAGAGYPSTVWPHLRCSTDPAMNTQSAQQDLQLCNLRRSSLHLQQQRHYHGGGQQQQASRRNSVTMSRQSNYSSDGTGQLPMKRGGSRMLNSRNGSAGIVHDAVPVIKDDIFSEAKRNNPPGIQLPQGSTSVAPSLGGTRKVSMSGPMARSRLASSRPSVAPIGVDVGVHAFEEDHHRFLAHQGLSNGGIQADGRTSALAKHYSDPRAMMQCQSQSPRSCQVMGEGGREGLPSMSQNGSSSVLGPVSHFSPPSSSSGGRAEEHPSMASHSSSSLRNAVPNNNGSEGVILEGEDPSSSSREPFQNHHGENIFASTTSTGNMTSASATASASNEAAAEARRGAHRRLYLRLREELSLEDLQKFEKYVHRYDALEIPVDGPRGLVNRVKKLLLLSDVTLRQRPDDLRRRKELAREFERVVSADV